MSPDYQEGLRRQVGDEIEKLVKPEEYGMSYANASFGLSQMTDSPMKIFYTEKLQAAKEGRAARTHDAKLSGFEQIEQLTRKGVFHTGGTDDTPMEMSRQRAIHDGFLGDTQKLGTWFSPEQAEEIRNAGGNTAREHAFKRIWASRANPEAKAGDPFVQATADAILNGDEKITYSTPESLRRAALRHTEAREIEAGLKDRLNDFLLVNPDASHQRINEEISKNVQGIGARMLASNKRTALPSWKSDAPAHGIYER